MSPSQRPPRILLFVAGEPLVRLMAWLFEDEGFEVAEVRSVAEARSRFPGPDAVVVVFNCVLSVAEKNRVMAEWRAQAPAVRFIDVAEHALLAEGRAVSAADAHFQMPFNSDDLIESARSLQL
jgi:DNA-binding NtrC family response regulator